MLEILKTPFRRPTGLQHSLPVGTLLLSGPLIDLSRAHLLLRSERICNGTINQLPLTTSV